MKTRLQSIVVSIFTIHLFAFAALAIEEPIGEPSELLIIQHTWAKTKYELSGKIQKEAFDRLLVQVQEQVELYPKQAELWVWKGIVESSFAGAKGGLGALSLAKKARKSLQKALELDETALQGSAYTSLGTLYHKVPGWPLGFGDDDEARVMLQKALKMNPEGIDPNYFYGEFLYDTKDYQGAIKHLQVALNAAARSERPLADSARRIEIETLIGRVKKRMDKNS
ncbi:MAG: tetratricopeptide (TPR) repeat protein [Alphaproteobacteria bacterium]|jgi:tetratricopeptide (TPR) repeat protein